jgi:steroid delta-isomerase-like uncharacterized protein
MMKKLFMILPLALILWIMVGCQDKEAKAELERYRAQAAVEEQNKELIRNFLGELDRGNWGIGHEIFADDCKFYSPSDSAPSSKNEFFAALDEMLVAFPKWEHDIKDLFAKDDKVIVWYIDITTHVGEFQGIPASGNKIRFGGIIIYRIQNGKIVEVVQESNTLGWMMQLGMELKPKEDKR